MRYYILTYSVWPVFIYNTPAPVGTFWPTTTFLPVVLRYRRCYVTWSTYRYVTRYWVLRYRIRRFHRDFIHSTDFVLLLRLPFFPFDWYHSMIPFILTDSHSRRCVPTILICSYIWFIHSVHFISTYHSPTSPPPLLVPPTYYHFTQFTFSHTGYYARSPRYTALPISLLRFTVTTFWFQISTIHLGTFPFVEEVQYTLPPRSAVPFTWWVGGAGYYTALPHTLGRDTYHSITIHCWLRYDDYHSTFTSPTYHSILCSPFPCWLPLPHHTHRANFYSDYDHCYITFVDTLFILTFDLLTDTATIIILIRWYHTTTDHSGRWSTVPDGPMPILEVHSWWYGNPDPVFCSFYHHSTLPGGDTIPCWWWWCHNLGIDPLQFVLHSSTFCSIHWWYIPFLHWCIVLLRFYICSVLEERLPTFIYVLLPFYLPFYGTNSYTIPYISTFYRAMECILTILKKKILFQWRRKADLFRNFLLTYDDHSESDYLIWYSLKEEPDGEYIIYSGNSCLQWWRNWPGGTDYGRYITWLHLNLPTILTTDSFWYTFTITVTWRYHRCHILEEFTFRGWRL